MSCHCIALEYGDILKRCRLPQGHGGPHDFNWPVDDVHGEMDSVVKEMFEDIQKQIEEINERLDALEEPDHGHS